MIKVLVIDDEPMQRQGIVRLTPWGDFGAEVIGAAGSGMEPVSIVPMCSLWISRCRDSQGSM